MRIEERMRLVIIDKESFIEYIERPEHKWKEAKTYAQSAPHSYILSFPCRRAKKENLCPIQDCKDPMESMAICQQCQDARAEFEAVVKYIRENGERYLFGRKIFYNIIHNDYQYWSYGDPIHLEIVLNKAIVDDPRCKVKGYWIDRND